LIDGAAKSLSEDFFKKFDAETAKIFSASQASAPSESQEPSHTEDASPSWLSVRNISFAALGLLLLYFILK
jgi:hypothetical protein